jgi:hypothetical protein
LIDSMNKNRPIYTVDFGLKLPVFLRDKTNLLWEKSV